MNKKSIIIFLMCLLTMLCSAIASVYARPQEQILALNSWYQICSNIDGHELAMFKPSVNDTSFVHKGADIDSNPVGCSLIFNYFERAEMPAQQLSGVNNGARISLSIKTPGNTGDKAYLTIVYKIRNNNEVSQDFLINATSSWNNFSVQIEPNVEYIKIFVEGPNFFSGDWIVPFYQIDNIVISEIPTNTPTPTETATNTPQPPTATPTPACVNVEYNFNSDNEGFVQSIPSNNPSGYASKVFGNGGVYLSNHFTGFPFVLAPPADTGWYGPELDNGLILYPGSYNYEQYGWAIPDNNGNGYFRAWARESVPGNPDYWELLWSRQTNNTNPPALGSFGVGYTGTLYIEFTDYDCQTGCGRAQGEIRAGRLDNLRIWQNNCAGTPTPTPPATNTPTPTATATPDEQCTTYDYSLYNFNNKGNAVIYGNWLEGIGLQSVSDCSNNNGTECIRTFINPSPYKDINSATFVFSTVTTKTIQLQSTNFSVISSSVSPAYTNTFTLNSHDDGYLISHLTNLNPLTIMKKEIICGRGQPTTPTPTQPPTIVLPPTGTPTSTPTFNAPPTATHFPTRAATPTGTPIWNPTPLATPTFAPINTDFYYSLLRSDTTCYWLLPAADFINFAGISVCFDWYELRLVAFGIEVPVYWLFAVISILLVFRIFIKST